MRPARATGAMASDDEAAVAHPAQPPRRCTDSFSTARLPAEASGGGGAVGAGSFWGPSASAQAGQAVRTCAVASPSFFFAVVHRSPGSSAQSRSVARRIESSARHAVEQSAASACA